MACAYFSAGMASPVKADWLTKKSFASSSRKSAGIMSPADNRTISPGTNVSIGISSKSACPPVLAARWRSSLPLPAAVLPFV